MELTSRPQGECNSLGGCKASATSDGAHRQVARRAPSAMELAARSQGEHHQRWSSPGTRSGLARGAPSLMGLAGNSLETRPASAITDGARQISLYGTRRGEFGRQKVVLFPEVIYIGHVTGSPVSQLTEGCDHMTDTGKSG